MPQLIQDVDLSTITIERLPHRVKLTSSYYVDNKKLSEAMIEWRKACDEAKAAGKERPRIPEYIGKSILDLAINMGKRHNFRNYSWLEEMISDAVLHACKYLHNFNPFAKTKSGVPSAYSYINRILWRSFTHRIEFEDREQYVKNASFAQLGGLEAFRDSDLDEVVGGGEEGQSGQAISVIGEELLRRAYEYEAKHGLGSKKKKEEPAEVESDLLLSFMEGAEEKPSEDALDQDIDSFGDAFGEIGFPDLAEEEYEV